MSENVQCGTAFLWGIAQFEMIHANIWPSNTQPPLTQNIPDIIGYVEKYCFFWIFVTEIFLLFWAQSLGYRFSQTMVNEAFIGKAIFFEASLQQ